MDGGGEPRTAALACAERGAPSATGELLAAVVERVLEEPEDDPEHCVADRRLAEGSAVGGELWQLVAGR